MVVNNFIKRAISGLFFVIILTTCIFIHPYCFFVLFFIINILGILEFDAMAKHLHIHINRPLCILNGSLLFTAGFIHNYWGHWEGYLIAFASTFLLTISELYRKDSHAFQNLAFGIYILFYLTLPFTLLIYFPYLCNGQWQPDIIFYPFLLVWLNDTFAYLCGITFGKHKLFPRISPKKSWEGAIGGGIITIVIGSLLAPYIDGISIIHAIVISGIVVFFGSYGDLTESMFKRCIEVKDSGNIMPGHGGVLDRLDSMLFAIPAIFVYLAWVTQ